MKHKATTRMLLTALCLLSSVGWASTTWYVNGESGSDTNNCTSAATACKTIGHAVSLASSGDSAMVTAATYTENLTIGKSLTILGSNASTTIIDGGAAGRVITISSATSYVTLSRITIRNGLAAYGAGIYNQGTLLVDHSTVSGNKASSSVSTADGGGIYSTGALTVNYSAVGGNTALSSANWGRGGGIYNTGTLTINSSTVNGNQAFGRTSGFGGGILTFGTVTILNSTLSGNTAGCGSIGCAGFGGGTYNYSKLTIKNTTLNGNSAVGHFAYSEGGGIANSGTLVISNSTLTGNKANKGGGIFGNGTVNNSTVSGNSVYVPGTGAGIYGSPTLQNSIIANSSSGGNCYATVTSKGYNLSSDGSCNLTGTGDMNNTDPMLGTLGNYGGPTQTIPLLSGSPAIDAGNPSGCTDGQGNLLKTDQRGAPRPDSEDAAGCDMGAYESQGIQ